MILTFTRGGATHLLCFCIIKEIGPVRISLHEAKLEQLQETDTENLLRDVVSGLLINLYALVHGDAGNELGGEDLLIGIDGLCTEGP